MVKISESELPLVTEAVLIWTGLGSSAWPRRNGALLLDRFDPETASRLYALIKSLESEFYSSDAWKTATDLQEMGRISSEAFKKLHPDVSDQVVRALAWCYTYDYR